MTNVEGVAVLNVEEDSRADSVAIDPTHASTATASTSESPSFSSVHPSQWTPPQVLSMLPTVKRFCPLLLVEIVFTLVLRRSFRGMRMQLNAPMMPSLWHCRDIPKRKRLMICWAHDTFSMSLSAPKR